MPTISLCICTRDRPAELERVLASVSAGRSLPEVVLVSDDSQAPGIAEKICSRFPFVQYLSGPRRGLCANRNAVISWAASDFICLSDDDCIISASFFSRLRELLPTLPGNTIITGDVIEDGVRIVPNNPSFLGHFRKPPNGSFRNINLNSNCFPRNALTATHFDESLIYGYEDMDLCAQLLRKGYRILHVPELRNVHAPPARAKRQERMRYSHAEQARFRTSLKRYMLWERKPHLAMLYIVVAPLHRAFHDFRRRRFADLLRIPGDVLGASLYALRSLRAERRRRSLANGK